MRGEYTNKNTLGKERTQIKKRNLEGRIEKNGEGFVIG
jgi:hypothetical protein